MTMSSQAEDLASELREALKEVAAKYGYTVVGEIRATEYQDSSRVRLVLDVQPTGDANAEQTEQLDKFGLTVGMKFSGRFTGGPFKIVGITSGRRSRRNPHPFWVLAVSDADQRTYRFPPRGVNEALGRLGVSSE